MNQEQIIQWALEAARSESSRLLGCGIDDLTAFSNLVARHQREQDARIADEHAKRNYSWASENSDVYHAQATWAEKIAAAIRSQDETTV